MVNDRPHLALACINIYLIIHSCWHKGPWVSNSGLPSKQYLIIVQQIASFSWWHLISLRHPSKAGRLSMAILTNSVASWWRTLSCWVNSCCGAQENVFRIINSFPDTWEMVYLNIISFNLSLWICGGSLSKFLLLKRGTISLWSVLMWKFMPIKFLLNCWHLYVSSSPFLICVYHCSVLINDHDA